MDSTIQYVNSVLRWVFEPIMYIHVLGSSFLFQPESLTNIYLLLASWTIKINQNVGHTIHRSYGIFSITLLFSAAGVRCQHRLQENKWNPRCRELLHGMGDGCRFQPLILQGCILVFRDCKTDPFPVFSLQYSTKILVLGFHQLKFTSILIMPCRTPPPLPKTDSQESPRKDAKITQKEQESPLPLPLIFQV